MNNNENNILLKINSLCYDIRFKIYNYYVTIQSLHYKDINYHIKTYSLLIENYKLYNNYIFINNNQINRTVLNVIDYNSDSSDISYDLHEENEIY